MERDDLLKLLKQLLDESMSDGFTYDFAAVDEGERGRLHVVTKTNEHFTIRAEED